MADRAIDAPARRQRPGSTENGNGLRGAGGLVAAVVPVTPGRLLKKSSRSVIKLSGALHGRYRRSQGDPRAGRWRPIRCAAITKVGKSDCEGTFDKASGNDEVAPKD